MRLWKGHNHIFKLYLYPRFERADFHRQRFQYTWLNSYSFSSLQESLCSWYSSVFEIILVVAIRVKYSLQPLEISGTSPRPWRHQFDVRVKYCDTYARPPLSCRAVPIAYKLNYMIPTYVVYIIFQNFII